MPFLEAGVPAVDIIDLDYPPWHTAEDTLDKVSRREIDLGAGVIAAMLYVVADLERTLPRNPVN